jgi:hypothetical protein
MSAPQGEYGRGRRAELARRLHDASLQASLELLPGKARELVDKHVTQAAELMRVSEQTAIKYIPPGWPEETAISMALEAGAPSWPRRPPVARFRSPLDRWPGSSRDSRSSCKEAVWRSSNEQLNAAVGEPLDGLSALSTSLSELLGDVDVERSELVGAARELGELADYISAGGRFLHQGDVDQDRLAQQLAVSPQRRDRPLLAEPRPGPSDVAASASASEFGGCDSDLDAGPGDGPFASTEGRRTDLVLLTEQGRFQWSRPEPELGPCSGERSRHDSRRPAGETPRSSKLAMPVRSRSPAQVAGQRQRRARLPLRRHARRVVEFHGGRMPVQRAQATGQRQLIAGRLRRRRSRS